MDCWLEHVQFIGLTDDGKIVIACIAVLANEIDKLKALEKEEKKEGKN